MPPTRTARKSTRGNTTVADAPGATLKSIFKAVGKNKGLKSSKNVGSAPSIAAGGEKPAVTRKSELIGVVVEEKKTTVKKSVGRNEESNVVKGKGREREKNAGAKNLKGGFEENKIEEVVEEVVAVVEGENDGNLEKEVERVESVQNTVVDVVGKQEEVVIEVGGEEEMAKNVEESTEEPLKKPVEAPIAKSSKSTKATRGNKRKATEIEVGEGRKETKKISLKAKESSAPEVITSEFKSTVEGERSEDAQPQIRARKRTRVQKETPATTTESTKVILDETAAVELPLETGDDSDYAEASTKGKASKSPRKKAPLKPKTPRSTRNATLLSIAASTLGQTTLSIPPTLTTSLSTVSATVEPDSEVTLSSLNTLLSNTSKEKGLGDKKRPKYLQQLANLHAHLLTAIHLHHAQNGTTSLPDFKGLKPHLERLSKRTVELADLRKICWLTNYDPDKIPIVGIDKIEKREAAQVEEVEVPKGRKGKKPAPKKVKARVKQEDEGKELENSRKGWLKTVDYGSGKIVLELVLSMAGVGEVNNLRREFERKIDAFWTEKGVQEEEGDQKKEVEIPMAEIIVSENKKMVDTVLKAKGQRRLLEMKGVQVLRGTGKGLGDEPFLSMKKPVVESKTSGATVPSPVPTITKAQKPAVEEEPFAPTSASSSPLPTDPPSSTPAPQDKKLSLLDRIRAKHQASLLAASQSPTASLSPEEIASNHARICAQQRLPEIIPILRSLRLRASGGGIGGAGTGRKSMSLEEVIVGIRQSVRSGITKEQAELCIRLIGEQGAGVQKQKQQGLSGDGGLGGKVTKEAEQRGKGGLLASWDQKDEIIAGNGRKDERGWVEIVECGGMKAVVFM